jgi:hypothetical protein
MNSLTFPYKGIHRTYHSPSIWNEVTAKQLLLWTAVLVSSFPEEKKLSYAVPIFYGIPENMYGDIKESSRLQIAPSLKGLFTENKLNKWLIPRIAILTRRFYGPADKLSNLTAYEFFCACEPLYWKYKLQGDDRALTALCAILYRPRRKDKVNNDLREEFTDSGMAKRAKLFRFLSGNTKRAIAFNYEGCRNFIVQMHPKAFKSSHQQSTKRGDVTLSLAGGPLGDLIATRNTNIYDFLLHLVRLIEQEEELKNR